MVLDYHVLHRLNLKCIYSSAPLPAVVSKLSYSNSRTFPKIATWENFLSSTRLHNFKVFENIIFDNLVVHPSKKGLVTSPPFTERFVIGNDYEMITIVRFEIFSIKAF